MKKILTSVLILCALSVAGFAQSSARADASLEAAMRNFRNAVATKNTRVFLSLISRSKGLTIMNTIDQGEAGSEDKPMLDSKLKYATLAADFKRKGGIYRDIFVQSPDSPSFFDSFAEYKGKWQPAAGNKFMPLENGEPVKALYVKWEKEGNRWVAVEVGRRIS